ncbi:hypothetical protein AB0M19_28350 [Streptomyces sp. NPDC051920]|uniref:hypothetical protein n=1 Tax=Streptomyces sp. NPDC051920 TaxID=3155523 RepID=UPI003432FEFC
MRKIAIGAIASGSLALSVLAAPTASAATPDFTFSKVVVNGGKAIVVGISNTVKVPVRYTLTHPADVVLDNKTKAAGILLYRGSLARSENVVGNDEAPTCTTTDSTTGMVTESCEETILVDPYFLFEAADATTWHAAGYYGRTDSDNDDSDGHVSLNYADDMWGPLASAQIKRAAKLTVNAGPEPVVKGRTLTVTGSLTRATWYSYKDATYTGYTGQPVALQFKAKGATAYKTVKTITSGTSGTLKTTVTASVDGTYRYSFAGTATTGTATATGDYIDVK